MAHDLALERTQRRLRAERVGGGKVLHAFRMGEKYLMAGTTLTREQILSIPFANRDALIGRFIEVWPEEANVSGAPAKRAGPPKRIIVHLGAGKFNVFEGWQVNADVMTKEEAQALAAQTGEGSN